MGILNREPFRLFNRMEPNPVSFAVNKRCHIAVLRGNLRFGYQDTAARFFYAVQYHLQIWIAIQVNQRSEVFGGLVKTAAGT